jgi:hypothetical protein
MMKMKGFAVTLLLLALLAGYGPAVADSPEARVAAQTASTRGDHEMVAKYHENAAREAQAKVEEQRQLLEQYESKSYLYGRQAQDLQSHTEALIRKLGHTADENIKQAALHRQMARQLPAAGTQRLSAAAGSHRDTLPPE